jgi:hypothetical protein
MDKDCSCYGFEVPVGPCEQQGRHRYQRMIPNGRIRLCSKTGILCGRRSTNSHRYSFFGPANEAVVDSKIKSSDRRDLVTYDDLAQAQVKNFDDNELLLDFFDVIPEPLLTIFDFPELELLMWCGLPKIDMAD